MQRLLEPGESLQEAALIWVRHSFSYAYGLAAFFALAVVAALAGFDQWTARIAIGGAGAAIAVAATTDYRILALSSQGLVLLRAGRVRQVAKHIMERPARDVEMTPIGSTMITADWRIDDIDYTVTRNSQHPIERIRTGRFGS